MICNKQQQKKIWRLMKITINWVFKNLAFLVKAFKKYFVRNKF